MPDAKIQEKIEEVQDPEEEEFDETSEGSDDKKRSGGIKQTIIIVAISQVLMAVAAFFFVKFYLTPLLTADAEEVAEEEVIQIEREPAQLILIEDLVVNPAETNGTRYLSATIGFEYAKAIPGEDDEEESGNSHGGEKAGGAIDNKTPIIRDLLIAILTSKNIEQLSSVEGKQLLRTEITDKINTEVAPDTVYKVYFVDYVLQ